MDIAVDGPNGIFSGLHQKKSKTRLKLWSDSYKQSAVILKKHSAKHLSVCTSGGCQQLIDARSVMKLCLIQPLAAHRWCSFKQHQLSLDILKITFGDSYRELTQPPAAGSEFVHLNIFFQKARTKKIEDWTGPAIKPRVLDARFFTSRSFIVMKHTSRHQFPPLSRTAQCCQISALNLAVEDVEYLINCVMLNNKPVLRSTHENALKLEDLQFLSTCWTRTNLRHQETFDATTWIMEEQTGKK